MRKFLNLLWCAIFSYFLFHLCLFDGLCSQYFFVLVIFLLSKHSHSFLICQFCFFYWFFFLLFIISMVHSSMPNSILIPNRVVYFFQWFLTPCVFPKYITKWQHSYKNIIDKNESPWKMSLWIFTSARVRPPVANSTLSLSFYSFESFSHHC